MKAIETHECTRTVPFTRGIQPLVGFDVFNLVSEEKRFNRVCLMPSFQAFSLAQPACSRNSLSYAIENRRDASFTMHACTFDNNEHVCHSLLVISSVAINIPLFI